MAVESFFGNSRKQLRLMETLTLVLRFYDSGLESPRTLFLLHSCMGDDFLRLFTSCISQTMEFAFFPSFPLASSILRATARDGEGQNAGESSRWHFNVMKVFNVLLSMESLRGIESKRDAGEKSREGVEFKGI